MNTIGLFYGSDTGSTEEIVNDVQNAFPKEITLHDIAKASKEDIEQYDKLIFASSTWGDGDLQADWEDFETNLQEIDFSGKTVALIGVGDQEGYPDTFCNALGHLYEHVSDANIVGFTSTDGYEFEESTAIVDDQFVGLILDDDNQSDLTKERIESWVASIQEQF